MELFTGFNVIVEVQTGASKKEIFDASVAAVLRMKELVDEGTEELDEVPFEIYSEVDLYGGFQQ